MRACRELAGLPPSVVAAPHKILAQLEAADRRRRSRK